MSALENEWKLSHLPFRVRLSSPSLSFAILILKNQDLHLSFDLKLEYLRIHCSKLSIGGEGSISYL